jgi:outer membrane protein
MKTLFCIALATTFSSSVWAADTAMKIGFVDLQKSLQTVDAGKQAKGALEKEVTAKREDLEKKEADLRKDAEGFEKKAAILSDAAKSAKQADLQKRFAELQKAAAESQMDLQKRERELTKPIIDELRSIIEGIGKEKGYTLVLERNEGGVLYAANGDDLTDDVISKFNSTHKGKSTKKKGE